MKVKFLVALAVTILVSSSAFGQAPPSKPNADVQKMIKEISAKNIEATIRKLVSFGTRNTLSEQDNPARGIGAARDWIFSEFQKIGSDCGGCLQVEKQTFTQAANPPPRGRYPKEAVLTNVYAVLK